MHRVLITGGAGFIGSNLCRLLVKEDNSSIINLDKLTYAGNRLSVLDLEELPNYLFIQGDIGDRLLLKDIFAKHQPTAIMHLAAETHVDRSISDPAKFIESNINGTYALLEEARNYFNRLTASRRDKFRFLAVSTDEVFGELGRTGYFTETSPYNPSSPYSASKASADHLARAYFRTYGLPTLITNCSNNYGPYQNPEKLIPLMISHALSGRPLPVYGRGENVRDWIYVDDHCQALWTVLKHGQIGQAYNIGARNEKCNLDIVRTICDRLEMIFPAANNPALQKSSYRDLITFVQDRPGHDFRYAIDPSRICSELGWVAQTDFVSGIDTTIKWYVTHRNWLQNL